VELAKPIVDELKPIESFSRQETNRRPQMIVSHAFAEFPNMLSVQQRIHDVSGGM
jgi:hypothetical protein